MKIVIASGYFNPLHSGHISNLIEAKKLGDKLIVIVNNDHQVKLKGSKEFLDEKEREIIVRNLKPVDMTMISISKDKSVCADLANVRRIYPDDELIFAKGGDRNEADAADLTSPLYYDIQVCKENNIEIVFNVGCDKVQSSSKILEKYK
jgi:cytidyltransferase-like protein